MAEGIITIFEKILLELQQIFPQHNLETIAGLVTTVTSTVGFEHAGIIIQSCIEQLLEIPEPSSCITNIPVPVNSGVGLSALANRNHLPVPVILSNDSMGRNSVGHGDPVHFKARSDINFSADLSRKECSSGSLTAQSSQSIIVNNDDIIVPGKDVLVEQAFSTITGIFKDVDEDWLRNEIKLYAPLPVLVDNIVARMLEGSDYPRAPKESKVLASCPFGVVFSDDDIDYFKEPLKGAYLPTYAKDCLTALQYEFYTVPTSAIRKVLRKNQGLYAPSWKMLYDALEEVYEEKADVSQTIIGSFLKSKRSNVVVPIVLDERLGKEIKFISDYRKLQMEKKDKSLASVLNARQYQEEGQAIECGCCFGDAVFEDMVQCAEGHLFCGDCLRNYSKETAYGTGKAQLRCMTDGCDSLYPLSQLQKVLSEADLRNISQREQDEAVSLAGLENLVRCPSCGFAAELPEEEKVFDCPSCRKKICRHCREDWGEHFGLRCAELERKDQKDLRKTYEELMTQAKVRTCAKCKASFLKESGCNKMTCRCGAKMCYICRAAGISYDHFCQHLRVPGLGCTKCKSCSLWTDPSEDDERAVREIQSKAIDDRKRKMEESSVQTSINLLVGPAPEAPVAAKKARLH